MLVVNKLKRGMPRHILVKFLKTEDRKKNSKVMREIIFCLEWKNIIQVTVDFKSETMVARRWHKIVRVSK